MKITTKQIVNDIVPDLRENLDNAYKIGLLTIDEYKIYLDMIDNINLISLN